MNNKNKIILGVGIIIILLIGYLLWIQFGDSSATDDVEEVASVATSTNPFTTPEVGDELVGERLEIPGGGSVALVKGVTDFNVGIEGSGTVAYLSSQAIDIENEGSHYIVAPIALDTGGTGSFLHLFLYEEVEGEFMQRDDVRLGDRVVLLTLTKNENYTTPRIVATLLERKEDEPLAADPTVREVVAFELIDGELFETPYYGE